MSQLRVRSRGPGDSSGRDVRRPLSPLPSRKNVCSPNKSLNSSVCKLVQKLLPRLIADVEGSLSAGPRFPFTTPSTTDG